LNFFVRRAAATLETFTTLGARGQERTVIDAPAPIDVLSSADIKITGRTETAQMIQAVAPSFNFPRTSIGDGTDHVRPATLRSLAPDQTLVLINGKRRHNSALVNVNGFVGRGSAPVDLNAIPASIIDRIEILRDGAAAQYGSDAIAGVINVILKQGAGGDALTVLGQTATTYNRADDVPVQPYPIQQGTRSANDGKTFDQSIDYGWSTADNTYLHLAGEFRDRGRTNRTLPDPRIQYFPNDPRETNPSYPLPNGRLNHLQGDASTHDLQGFWNGGTRFGDIEGYTFGGLASRKGEAAGFWRRANDPSGRRMPAIYPDGFLPRIHSDIIDASGAIGAKGQIRGWDWDLASVYGGNQFGFVIKNSMNVSMGLTSPTEFDAGKLRFQQSTTTLDLQPLVQGPPPVPLDVAAGAEFRADKYTIVAGETSSWINAGGRVPDQNGNPTTSAAPPGAQVFPGFKADSSGKPGDAGSHSRSNTALYLDLSSDVTSKWLLDVAGRFEHYSDFGTTTTGKLSTRYEFVPGYALRGSVSTGFRAPSLMQEFFSSTATNFVSGVPFDIKTFPASTPEAGALGASPLKAEQSTNVGFGMAIEPIPGLVLHGGLLLHRDRRPDRAVEQLHREWRRSRRSPRSESRACRVVGTSPTPSTRALAATTSSPTTESPRRRIRCFACRPRTTGIARASLASTRCRRTSPASGPRCSTESSRHASSRGIRRTISSSRGCTRVAARGERSRAALRPGHAVRHDAVEHVRSARPDVLAEVGHGPQRLVRARPVRRDARRGQRLRRLSRPEQQQRQHLDARGGEWRHGQLRHLPLQRDLAVRLQRPLHLHEAPRGPLTPTRCHDDRRSGPPQQGGPALVRASRP
jgi:outer membrane receptor protein involved in Fe transport